MATTKARKSTGTKRSNRIKKGKALQQVKPLSKGSVPAESVSLDFSKIEWKYN